METSIRYGGDSKALKIHAKQKLFISSNTRFQVFSFPFLSFFRYMCFSYLLASLKIRLLSMFSNHTSFIFLSVWQVHGELDTKSGAPSYLSAMIRHFYPDLSASLGVGVQYNRREKLRYNVRAKKSIPVTTNGVVLFNIKGRVDVDKEFTESKARGAAEFTLGVLDFQDNQDVRLKVGYEVFDKTFCGEIKCLTGLLYKTIFDMNALYLLVPYMQIKENNWTFNVDINGKWNVRYDL
ncbi:hypothetical protein RHSIM_Rhsim06G0004200 [Rhododendron simsii]|uniref:Uncharacterized protein n=1 Tax=Rhododendron simsii TaxID=118357 RepID=A0A834LKM2_RHOSS|nr:hypothetical protein RHSIM_Rhsim06G0004200 [Rhododendron simsii]